MDDIVVIVADSFEQLEAIAEKRQYHVLYDRAFDAILLDGMKKDLGEIVFEESGVVAIAKRL